MRPHGHTVAADVLHLVAHCAGRAVPDDDEHSVSAERVRIVATFITSPKGRYAIARVRHAQRCVQVAAQRGDGGLLDVLLRAIGHLAALDDYTAGGDRGTVPRRTVNPQRSRELGSTPSAPTEPTRRRVPVIPRVRDCPPDRATCSRTDCRHFMGGETTPHPCSLELARHGPHTLQSVANMMGVSRERIRQLEERALATLRAANFELEQPSRRELNYVEHAELAAPGEVALDLRGCPENWRR